MADLDHRSLEWAVEIIGMCEPIRCVQGGMWFGRNHNFADATFVDYGAADAFAVAAKSLPDLVKALKSVLQWYGGDPDDLSEWSDCMLEVRAALAQMDSAVGSSSDPK